MAVILVVFVPLAVRLYQRVRVPAWRRRPLNRSYDTWSDMDINWVAFAPIIVLVVAFVGYCLFDLSRNQPRLLPRWAWAVICVASVPLGGVVYLLIGRGSGNSP